MSSKRMMTPGHTNPSPRSSPTSIPPAAPSRPKTAPNTPNVPASTSSSHGLVERPYAPVLPPSTNSQDQETVEALVGLRQLSPKTANLTSSFSAINAAIPNGLPNSSTRTSAQYDYSSNIPSPVTHTNDYSPDTTQDTRSADASSTRPRRRRRSNSAGVESPRDHTKPYDGHVLEEDTVMGDASQHPLAPSPLNLPQAPQRDPHRVPHPLLSTSIALSRRENKSKQHSRSHRQQLPPPYHLLSPRAQQELVCRTQQPIVRYSKQTNRPQMPRPESPHTYSTDADGFMVLHGAVRVEKAQAAANILDHGMEKVQIQPTHKEFGLCVQAYEVRDNFVRNVPYETLSDFRPPSPSFALHRGPIAIMVSEYLPAADPSHARYSTVQTANAGLLYVIVALTALKFRNGLFTFLGGSHANKNPRYTPMDQWNRVQTELHPGDALIWRGDLKYLLSPYGGGKYLTILFQWVPKGEKPVVDLTK